MKRWSDYPLVIDLHTLKLRTTEVMGTMDTPCWIWDGHLNPEYGRATIFGQRMYAHRAACILSGVHIPPKYDVDHICRTPPCCNPAHLEPMTRRDNLLLGRNHRLSRSECRNGHPLTRDNIYPWINKSGSLVRVCKTCKCAQGSELRQRREGPAGA